MKGTFAAFAARALPEKGRATRRRDPKWMRKRLPEQSRGLIRRRRVNHIARHQRLALKRRRISCQSALVIHATFHEIKRNARHTPHRTQA
jgi:alpha-ketoglutarate-dependent taurine dioxygenase